ncbi:MAG: NTP transferase domain-containing protein [Phycisphaerales bacterium]|nr:NTP transferase domain-containing protein [Phycisphaerales bacterium]
MRTEIPKVLHAVLGRPMLAYVVDACREAGVADCVGVVGYGKDQVIAAFRDDARVQWVEQTEQRGTGHAVLCCRAAVLNKYEHVLVLCGDGPLIRGETIRQLVDKHLSASAAATLATAVLDDPTGYGRIQRDAAGKLLGIIEQGDCTPEQRAIREVNPSYYCFRTADLFFALDQVKPNNSKNEYYLTDAIAILTHAGRSVQAVTAVPPQDVFAANTRQELALLNRVMRERINDRHMTAGVTIVDPATTWIDARAEIGADTIIHPFVQIDGPVRIGRNCTIGPFARVAGAANVPDGATHAPIGGAPR